MKSAKDTASMACNTLFDYAMFCCDSATRHVEALDGCALARPTQSFVQVRSKGDPKHSRKNFDYHDHWIGAPNESPIALIPRRHLELSCLLYDFAKTEGWCEFQTTRFAAHLSNRRCADLLSLNNPGRAGKSHHASPPT